MQVFGVMERPVKGAGHDSILCVPLRENDCLNHREITRSRSHEGRDTSRVQVARPAKGVITNPLYQRSPQTALSR